MQLLALIASLITIGVGSVVGVRMLLLSRRTGRWPERYVGGSLLLYAGIGQPLLIASRPIGDAYGYEARFAAVSLALLAMLAALVGFYLFTWTVFRRNGRWGAAVVWIGAGVGVAAVALIVPTIPRTPGEYVDATRLGLALFSLDFSAAMAWTASESLLYHRQMRRRLALGLADSLVVNRFLLWGVGCAATGIIPLVSIACVAAGLDVVVHPLPLLLRAVGGCVISGCWYLTFFPPRGYTRWLESRAQAHPTNALDGL